MSNRISRRAFVKRSVVAGIGAGALAFRCHPWQNSLSIGVCGPVDDHELFAESGYVYIEPTVQRFLVPEGSESEFEQQLRVWEASKLPIPVANQFLPGHLKVVGPEMSLAKVLSYAETTFKRARTVGIEQIVFGSGGARYVPDGFDEDVAKRQIKEVLEEMAPLAQAYGITLCMEPLRQQETNFLNTVPEMMDIISTVSHPAVQLTFDIYHVTQEGRDESDVAVAGSAVHHCHIAEDRDRAAPGVHGEDFTVWFKALNAISYSGRMSVECRWQNRPHELSQAVAVLTGQMGG